LSAPNFVVGQALLAASEARLAHELDHVALENERLALRAARQERHG